MSRESPDTSRVNLPLKQAIEALLTDRPVAYHPIITRVVGSATAGLFLSQLLYWTPRTQDPEGWVYKTQDDILEETGLTRTEQETARRILRGAQIMEERKKGLPAKLYFRVNMDQLIELLAAFQPKPGKRRRPAEAMSAASAATSQGSGDAADKDAGILQPRMRESRGPARGDAAGKNAANPHTLTENTTEITTETVVVVRAALEKFGLTTTVAEQLVLKYPEEYITGKLDFVQWLVETNSPLVGRNPAGYLRRAIEEDWSPPPKYKPRPQRQAEERERDAALVADQERRRAAEHEYLQSREETEDQLLAATPPTPVAGTDLTTADVWEATLSLLRDQVTGPIFFTYLKHTRLVSCTETQAVVATVYSYTAEQLAERHHHTIVRALQQVLDRGVSCTYVSLGELEQSQTSHSAGEGGGTPKRRSARGSYAAG